MNIQNRNRWIEISSFAILVFLAEKNVFCESKKVHAYKNLPKTEKNKTVITPKSNKLLSSNFKTATKSEEKNKRLRLIRNAIIVTAATVTVVALSCLMVYLLKHKKSLLAKISVKNSEKKSNKGIFSHASQESPREQKDVEKLVEAEIGEKAPFISQESPREQKDVEKLVEAEIGEKAPLISQESPGEQKDVEKLVEAEIGEKASFTSAEIEKIESEFLSSIEQIDIEKVKELLRKKPDLVNIRRGIVLHKVITGGERDIDKRTELLQILLNSENINSRYRSKTPLEDAIASGLESSTAERIADVLLNTKGINVNAGNPILILAVVNGYPNIVKKLLNAGADVNDVWDTLHTAYHMAIIMKREDMIEILANAERINLNALCKDGHTGIHEAVYRDYFTGDDYSGIVKKLSTLEKVNMNARGKDGGTALHLSAALPGQIKMFEALLDTKKIDVNAIDNDGKTALFHVVKSPCKLEEKIEKIKKLVEAGINLGIADKYGDTALHEAISTSDYNDDIVQVLLDAGANTRIVNKDGKTTFEKAVENKRLALINRLKENEK